MNVVCPYCAGPFAKIPKRRRKCPTCKQTVFIKYTPDNRTKRLMTEVQAAEADKLWAPYHQRQQTLKTIYPFGFGEAELEQWMALAGDSEETTVDKILLSVTINSPKLHERKVAYMTMALRADKKSEPFKDFLIEARRCELLRLKESRVARVEILTAGIGKACSKCEKLHGRVWDVDEALARMPLPCPQCQGTMFSNRKGFCGCMYVADVSHLGVSGDI